MVFFGCFWTLLPQILFNLAEILTTGILPIRQKQCLKNLSKFWILAQMESTQRLQFPFISGPNLLPGNSKYCLKPKFLEKTTSLGISNNVSPMSQKNHRILVKLSKKNIFWAKIYKSAPGATSKGYQKFLHSL